MIINHGKWRRENSVIIKMFLMVHYTGKIIIRGLTKSTYEIISIDLDTYFPNQKWKSTLVKEMMVSQCITSTTLNNFKPVHNKIIMTLLMLR